MLNELYKCRERPSAPFSARCDTNLPRIVKAADKRDKTIEKQCESLDPVRAFGYDGCQAPGCESADQSAAGYQACKSRQNKRYTRAHLNLRKGLADGLRSKA